MINTIYNYDARRQARFTSLVELEKHGFNWYVLIDGQTKAALRETKPTAIEWVKNWAIDKGIAITFDKELHKRLINDDNAKFKTA